MTRYILGCTAEGLSSASKRPRSQFDNMVCALVVSPKSRVEQFVTC